MRSLIEPGPIMLVSSHWKGKNNIMTMGWHMVMEFSTIGCYIWDQNHSFDMIHKSKECVINIPTHDIIREVIAIGNSSGDEIDKFEEFDLTPEKASKVKAPLIRECYANFECKLVDASLISKYSLFVFDVVKAHVATSPRFPRTVHYRGNGRFMVSGKEVDYDRYFGRGVVVTARFADPATRAAHKRGER
ncbi:MAG TPA: flavin reductase family protein [Pseudorhodoplanes sp.]|nr:flavin reductase family protein [Pseudorhodoplanes sp.]